MKHWTFKFSLIEKHKWFLINNFFNEINKNIEIVLKMSNCSLNWLCVSDMNHESGVLMCSVHLCARSAVRAAAAHSPDAVPRERASPCGLNKEKQKKINQLMMKRHEAAPGAGISDRFDSLIWTRSWCPRGGEIRFSTQPLRSLSAGSQTETRAGLRVFSLNEAAQPERDSSALTR